MAGCRNASAHARLAQVKGGFVCDLALTSPQWFDHGYFLRLPGFGPTQATFHHRLYFQNRFLPMKSNKRASLYSALGAIGVVYGDIGTSVLYAFRECLAHGISGREEILGVLSLIFWTLTLLVTVKYLTFVMRADNEGEGGILALLSLAFPESVSTAEKSRLTIAMIGIGVSGAALLYGDGVLTPAISVLLPQRA